MKWYILSAAGMALFLSGLVQPTLAGDWPQFRGPRGQGHSDATGLPREWSETQNVAFKTPIAGLGWSSPSLQGNQIWLTTALDNGHSLRAVCLDRQSGDIIHDVEVFAPAEPGAIHKKNSHASPTPLIDADKVYVHYGAHGTACLSTDGKIAWKTNELKYKHQHGPAGSPVVWKDLLILNCDGVDVQFVVALDKRTGTVVWKSPREHISEARKKGQSNAPMAYSTPILIEVAGQTQLITAGSDQISALDPATGREIWWFNYDGYSNVLRPVFGHGMVFTSSGYDNPVFYAIRVGGQGDVTQTHEAWTMKKAAPLDPSPLLVGDELYLISNSGICTCLNAVSGEKHWQQRLGGEYSASPVFADGLIYVLDEEGTATVFKAGKEFEKIGENKLPGRTLASIVPVDHAIFLRTDTHLYRIEAK